MPHIELVQLSTRSSDLISTSQAIGKTSPFITEITVSVYRQAGIKVFHSIAQPAVHFLP